MVSEGISKIEFEQLLPLFTTNHEEYHKRQAILARKMQTLERSRMLLTKQRTRQSNNVLEPDFLPGRVTRSRLKDLNKTEEEKDNKTNKSGGVYKDSSQIQIELERQKRQEKIETEKSAREQRRQKRVLRNEFPTSENKDEFRNIDWSSKEIIREFNRVRALKRREKNKRKKKNGRASRKRRRSVDTEEETDLFENPEDFEWPDLKVSPKPESGVQTNSGRAVTNPKPGSESEDLDTQSLKIIMEANVYRLLGKQEQGMEEMKIF